MSSPEYPEYKRWSWRRALGSAGRSASVLFAVLAAATAAGAAFVACSYGLYRILKAVTA